MRQQTTATASTAATVITLLYCTALCTVPTLLSHLCERQCARSCTVLEVCSAAVVLAVVVVKHTSALGYSALVVVERHCSHSSSGGSCTSFRYSSTTTLHALRPTNSRTSVVAVVRGNSGSVHYIHNIHTSITSSRFAQGERRAV
jgi:hypothetical protein